MGAILGKISVAIIATAVVSCGVCRRQPTITVRDSVRTEVKEVTTYIHDTVRVALPVQVERVIVQDSSHLYNDIAESFALVDSAGFLHHSLISRGSVDVQVEIPTHSRDSIVYIDKVRVLRVPVIEQRPLTWWQQFRLQGFWLLLVILGLWLVIKFSPVIKNILRILKIPFS